MRTTSFLLIAAVAATPLYAGAPKDAPATLMLQPGKILVSEDLNQPFGKGWFGNPGDWKVVDGVMRGVERASDSHAAVRRREVSFKSAIVSFQFRFDGATMMSLSMNAEKGHVCRVRITPDGFTLIRDKDKVKNDKPVELDKVHVKIAPKEWHTMVVEMAGTDMVAQLDGKQIGLGANAGLAVPKASVGFTVQGDAMSFKNLRVYEGSPLKSWEQTKAKLLAQRKK